MAHGIKTLSASQTGYLAVVQWYHQSVRQRMFLCSAGLRAVAGATYQPKILFVSDVVCDAGGESRFALLLNQHGPFAVYAGEDGDTTGTSHASLADVLRTYPNIYAQGTVTLFLEGRSDDTTTTTTAQEMVAAIRAITNAGLNSVTMECEQRNTFQLALAPKRVVGEGALASGERAYQEFAGEPFPITHGNFVPGVPWTMPAWMLYAGGVFGWKIPLAEAVPKAQRNASSVVAAYTDASDYVSRASSSYAAAYIDLDGTLAYAYSLWYDASGNGYGGTDGSMGQDQYCHWVHFGNTPWCYVPIIPRPVGEGSVDNLQKAVDGNPDTYAVLAPGTTVNFEIPSVSALGRISCNSTDAGNTAGSDYEGPFKPVGLKVVALFVRPNGANLPSTSATQTLTFANADGSTLFGATGTLAPPRTALEAKLHQVNIPYMTGADQDTGWNSTRLHRWEFTSSSVNHAGNPDKKLYTATAWAQNKPLLLKVTNGEAAASTQLAAVVLLVGCEVNREPSTALVKDSTGFWGRFIGNSNVTGVATDPERMFADAFEFASRMHPWGPGGLIRPRRRRAQLGGFTKARGTQIRVANTIYRDDVGTFTGTVNAILTDPLHAVRHVLQNYGAVEDSEIATGGEFGSYTAARASIAAWFSGGATTHSWAMNRQTRERTSVEDLIAALADGCLDLSVRRMPNGKYGFFHWFPVAGMPASRWYDSLTPIDVRRRIVAVDGVPQVDTSRGDTGGVVNELEVLYRGAVPRTAKASVAGSDDGLGAAWGYGGVLPYSSGLTAAQLCALSVERFGARDKVTVDMADTELAHVAVAQGMYRLAREWEPPITLRMTATPALYDLWPGHVFRLSNDLETVLGSKPVHWGPGATWESIYWTCERNEQRSYSGVIVQEITATCLPYWVGDMTRGGMWGGRDAEDEAFLEGE